MVVDSSSPSGYRGFCIDLLDEIARAKGFNYTIYRVNTYGKYDKQNGTWNGVMAELINRVRLFLLRHDTELKTMWIY